MWFAHYCYHRNLLPSLALLHYHTKMCHDYPTGRPYRTSFELWQQHLFVVIWDGTDDIHKPRDTPKSELFANFCTYFVQRDTLVGIVGFDEFRCNPRGNPQ
jgi:hypothetical protein